MLSASRSRASSVAPPALDALAPDALAPMPGPSAEADAVDAAAAAASGVGSWDSFSSSSRKRWPILRISSGMLAERVVMNSQPGKEKPDNLLSTSSSELLDQS